MSFNIISITVVSLRNFKYFSESKWVAWQRKGQRINRGAQNRSYFKPSTQQANDSYLHWWRKVGFIFVYLKVFRKLRVRFPKYAIYWSIWTCSHYMSLFDLFFWEVNILHKCFHVISIITNINHLLFILKIMYVYWEIDNQSLIQQFNLLQLFKKNFLIKKRSWAVSGYEFSYPQVWLKFVFQTKIICIRQTKFNFKFYKYNYIQVNVYTNQSLISERLHVIVFVLYAVFEVNVNL